LALRVDVDFDYCLFDWSAASLPERSLSSVSLDPMRFVILAGFAVMLLAVTSRTKERSIVSVSSEPTGLTVKSQRSGKTAVETLLRSLDRTRFYKITEDSFNAEVDSSHRPGEVERIVITDCPIWTLRTRNGGITRLTKFYGLWEMAEHYPNIKQLKTLQDAFLMVYSTVGEKPS
jgi:hypothetical protein